MKIDRDALRKLIPEVEAALEKASAAVGKFEGGAEYPAWRRRHDDATAKMVETLLNLGGAVTYRPPHDHTVRLAGIKSSSTTGYFGAVGNWLTAAKRRLGEPVA